MPWRTNRPLSSAFIDHYITLELTVYSSYQGIQILFYSTPNDIQAISNIHPWIDPRTKRGLALSQLETQWLRGSTNTIQRRLCTRCERCATLYMGMVVEWGYFYDERRGSSGGGGREGKTEEFTWAQLVYNYFGPAVEGMSFRIRII